MRDKLIEFQKELSGDLYFDEIHKLIYSTDASAYREKPLAVFFPKNEKDIRNIIHFTHKEKISLIPRGAGTSLAGQVTGKGIIVDVSKYMDKILNVDKVNQQVTVQGGVILSELNKYLEPNELFFGPETSTANRCTIAGMVGNNACGLHSLAYGSTRDHTVSVKAILSDGSDVEFKELTIKEFNEKCLLNTLEGRIYKNIRDILSEVEIAELVEKEYPDPKIPRRNTGYALDLLLKTNIFGKNEEKFNFCSLIAGSEGTLAFITKITLNLLPLPPKNKALIVVHFDKLEHAFYANLIALKYKPTAVELADKIILDCTKSSIGLQKNRFFLKGDPEAILIIEFVNEDAKKIEKIALNLEKEMKSAGYGYHFPFISGDDIEKVWHLRRAGLGVLSNMPGDSRPVSLVEDTAVLVEKLPDYIKDFQKLLIKHELNCVYHAHIGTGELHLRPVLNLKDKKDVELFRTLAFETAKLVKKYNGSLSGEHGDGRLRGEFIPLMYGERIYSLFKKIKSVWDPYNIFNPGKITDTPPMNEFLRYVPGHKTKKFETVFDFSETKGYLRAVEKCNGSGDCLKSKVSGGTMCPSYMATKDEKTSTRARANMLREILTNEDNPFNNKDLYEVLVLCLSCKACKSECPSNVDITKLKAEFLQHYYDINKVPFRSKMIANITKINKILAFAPGVSNFFLKNNFFSKNVSKLTGFHPNRKLPEVSKPLRKVIKNKYKADSIGSGKTVYLFVDEFTSYNDTTLGVRAYLLLNKLGYNVIVPKHTVSGRTYLSKGLIRKAKKMARKNIELLKGIITENTPLIGIEPSTVLTFKDEYPDFFGESYKINKRWGHLYTYSREIAENAFLIDEFLASEMKNGNINKDMFTKEHKNILLHGHCQQKALITTDVTKYCLSFPENYTIDEIPSGCCGMAGAFGYEKEHYELSMKIGDMVLFPAVRKASEETIIAANGTSCRHQIKDGTGKTAKHTVDILWEALL